MSMAAESIFDALSRSFARMGRIAICDACIRRGEMVHDVDRFGDFSLCGRCRRPTTSRDVAIYVDPGEP
jgi:hypothetical protein